MPSGNARNTARHASHRRVASPMQEAQFPSTTSTTRVQFADVSFLAQPSRELQGGSVRPRLYSGQRTSPANRASGSEVSPDTGVEPSIRTRDPASVTMEGRPSVSEACTDRLK